MKPGDRVRVAATYHWAQNATGTIWDFPPQTYEEGPYNPGPYTVYFVEFDEPQYDADGDGPYSKAEIDVAALTRLSRQSLGTRLRRRVSRPLKRHRN